MNPVHALSHPHPPSPLSPAPDEGVRFGLIVVGDEILSGKRADKHLPKVTELLAERGLQLTWAEYVGDDPARITDVLKRAFDSGDVVFCTGGIGATPDDHTRPCAARALGVDLVLHADGAAILHTRMKNQAAEAGLPYEPDRADNVHRLNMAVFPVGAHLVPNPYNQVAGFSCAGFNRGRIYFVPGFPVMAWPMIAWALDTDWSAHFHRTPQRERSVIVYGAMEATLTPLMQQVEADHPGVKVFSLPSVDHPTHGRHIELGVKGAESVIDAAFAQLLAGLAAYDAKLGPQASR